jgi:hypothetical protein
MRCLPRFPTHAFRAPRRSNQAAEPFQSTPECHRVRWRLGLRFDFDRLSWLNSPPCFLPPRTHAQQPLQVLPIEILNRRLTRLSRPPHRSSRLFPMFSTCLMALNGRSGRPKGPGAVGLIIETKRACQLQRSSSIQIVPRTRRRRRPARRTTLRNVRAAAGQEDGGAVFVRVLSGESGE